ncbi:hypothetical protein V8C35DRAFT_278601 [Trichoderma chlorosporum]
MASTDVNSIVLTTPSTRLLRMLTELRRGTSSAASRSITAGELMGVAALSDQEETDVEDGVLEVSSRTRGMPEERARAEKVKSRSRPLPAAGTQEVNQISVVDPTGGLEWYFYNKIRSQSFMSELAGSAQI